MGLFNLTPELLLANAIALLVGMTVHEFAHCYVADRMGDPTPRSMGRLTLNPFVHINWLGFVLFAIIGFGVLGTAPVSPGRMRSPRWGGLATYAAGPVSNLILAALFAFVLQAMLPSYFDGDLPYLVVLILDTLVTINVLLFVFNLIPLFPLDGWRVVMSLLPAGPATWWMENWRPSYYLFIGLILFSLIPPSTGLPNILGTLVGRPTVSIAGWLIGYGPG